jgi:hypothetical protein
MGKAGLAKGRKSSQRADQSDTARPPERRKSSSPSAIFPALARHERRLAFALQEIGVESFYAQGINQQRAAAPSLPQNLNERLSPACPVEGTLTDARRAQDSEKLRLRDRQRSAPVDDDRRRWGLPSLHIPNRNTKGRIANRIYAVYFSMITSVLFRSI